MPDLPSTSGHLSLVPEKSRLYPKFQSYKLQSYEEETRLRRIRLPIPPSRPMLPTNAQVGFHDVRVRTTWNHLSQGWQSKSVLYVGNGGAIVRIEEGQAKLICSITLGSRTDSYGYYARVLEIGPDLLIVTDGFGQMLVIQSGLVVGSLQEEIPFILFDAVALDNEVFVLVCHALPSDSATSTSRPPKGDCLVRKLRLNLSSKLEYTVVMSLSGSEIPKHAILKPDIVLVTQSPYRFASAPIDS